MQTEERQRQIYEYLSQKKSATVAQLCARFYTSPATLRRDLARMEQRGLIHRTHGGAAFLEGSGDEISVFAREGIRIAEKHAIGELAACYIKDGSTLFFDTSSTVCSIVPYLRGYKNLTVITNGLHCALALSRLASCQVLIPGGRLAARSNSVVGSETLAAIEQYHVDAAIISCAGFSLAAGATESAAEQACLKNRMLRHADQKLLLCDSSKFERVFLRQICAAAEFDFIFTEKMPPQEYLDFFRKEACELVWPE